MNTETRPVAYCDNTGYAASRDFHKVIMEAIANGGVFGEDFADIFVLSRVEGGNWVLNFA